MTAVLGLALMLGSVVGSNAGAGATGFSATARQLSGAPTNLLAHPVALVRLGTSVYIVDANAIERWDVAAQTFSNFAGNRAHAGSRDGIGTSARFDAPKGIATDGTDLYVADTGNDVIRKVTVSSGAVSTIAGRAGHAGSSDGQGRAARFDQPWGISEDGGDLWIADRGNFTVRAVTIATGEVETRAGLAGQSAHQDGVGADARFTDPRALMNESGAVWVTDGARVRRIEAVENKVTTLATIHEPGNHPTATGVAAGAGIVYVAVFLNDHDDTTGTEIVAVHVSNGSVEPVPTPYLRESIGLTIDRHAEQLTVVGYGTFYPSLFRITLHNGKAHDLAPFNETGFADGTAADARFSFANGLALNDTTVFVVDEGNHAIRAVDRDTGAVGTVAHDVGFSLTGLALDNDTLYVADDTVVRRVDVATGDVSAFATLPSRVYGVTIAGSNLYAVANDCALYRVPLATGVPTVFAGAAGSCGSADGTGSAARFGADATCPACPPQGIANDGTDLFVADHLAVRKVAIATAAVSTIVPAGPPYDPQIDIAVADGQVYVARIGSIVRVAATGGPVFQVTSRNYLVDHLGTLATRAGHTYLPPSRLAADPDGHQLYVSIRTGVGVIEDP